MNKVCECGRVHKSSVGEIITENGAINYLPKIVRRFNAEKAFVLADKNTYKAAGERVCSLLSENGISYSKYVFASSEPAPDESSVGSAVMNYDANCDIIISIGSGVMNDIGKILSKTAGRPYIIVATAPSMDGYASATSSMEKDGLKVSLPSKCPDVIIGDIDILKAAPMHMLQAGLGDMLAKYISICEWRIANLLIDEYYCEYVADTVRKALKKCVDNADGLLKRDDDAVKAVFEGLVMGGMAMEYAGMSRPASGVEHYISHVWDMRGLAFGTPVDLHGIQCGIGTLIAARAYEQIKNLVPDKEKALEYAATFDADGWNNRLREFIGEGAEAMIELDKKERKYDEEKHKVRLGGIIDNWDAVLEIINEEVPTAAEIEHILEVIGAPQECSEIGIDAEDLPMTFKASKDIRDKYVLSRLCWDLGVIDEIQF